MSVARFPSIRTLAAGSLSSSYASIGTPFQENLRAFRLVNNTPGDLLFTTDVTTDQFFVPAMSFVLYDLCANAANIKNSDWLVTASLTQFSAKTVTAAPTGNVWVEGVSTMGV